LKELKSVEIAPRLTETAGCASVGGDIDVGAPMIVCARLTPAQRKVAGRDVGIKLVVLVDDSRDNLKVPAAVIPGR